jgi:hypothetical protein
MHEACLSIGAFNMDIELFFFGTEIYSLDVPRIFEIQCHFKEVFL